MGNLKMECAPVAERTPEEQAAADNAAMEKAFWRNYFGEEYFNNYLGPGVSYQDDVLDHLPTFQEISNVNPTGAEGLAGKSIACLGSAFGHEMQVTGVEISAYCMQRILPSAADLTTESDIRDWLPLQADNSFDYVLVTCLEYIPTEEALDVVLGHIARITRTAVFVVCVQSDVGDFYDELPVAILRAHSWWDEAFKKHGFQGLSKDEFIQYAAL